MQAVNYTMHTQPTVPTPGHNTTHTHTLQALQTASCHHKAALGLSGAWRYALYSFSWSSFSLQITFNWTTFTYKCIMPTRPGTCTYIIIINVCTHEGNSLGQPPNCQLANHNGFNNKPYHMHEYHIMNTLTFSLVLSLVSESTKKPLFLFVCA